ncbi:MAG: hypothetical protein EHM64_12295 [Ignavibacteriae bacterium]|nr:MAG: hypothetical protein EHM64_12295 [Ignavibacteriota bacterium]
MDHSKIKYLLIFLIAALPTGSQAGGSAYSRYGFGDILRNGDSRTYAMSGTGISLIDDGFINLLNPAGLARISYTRFSSGFEYTNFLSKDETGSSFYSTGSFQGLAFAFPISKEHGMVMAAEFNPYSKVRYGITALNIDTLIQEKTLYGSGGLSSMSLSISATPLNSLAVGARLNYMYGSTRQYQTSVTSNASYTATTFDRNTYFSGFTLTLGAIYEGVADLFSLPSLRPLTLGMTLTTASALDAELKETYPGISYTAGDTVVSTSGTAGLPLSLGFGLSYLFQDRYRFMGDIVSENWASTEYFGSRPADLRNSFRASAGFEALPAKEANSFWKRIVYRTGIAYHSTYYQINGVGINEFLVSGGLGLPMGPESQLNIGLQIGIRGSTDHHLQKDTIIRLSAAISASEIWFLRFDEE